MPLLHPADQSDEIELVVGHMRDEERLGDPADLPHQNLVRLLPVSPPWGRCGG